MRARKRYLSPPAQNSTIDWFNEQKRAEKEIEMKDPDKEDRAQGTDPPAPYSTDESAEMKGRDSDSEKEQELSANNPYAPTDADFGDARGMDKEGEPDYLHPDGTPTEEDNARARVSEPTQTDNADELAKAENADEHTRRDESDDLKRNSNSDQFGEDADSAGNASTYKAASSESANRDGDPLANENYADPRRMPYEDDLDANNSKKQKLPDYMHPDGKPNK
jgi:hypothetical protein